MKTLLCDGIVDVAVHCSRCDLDLSYNILGSCAYKFDRNGLFKAAYKVAQAYAELYCVLQELNGFIM